MEFTPAGLDEMGFDGPAEDGQGSLELDLLEEAIATGEAAAVMADAHDDALDWPGALPRIEPHRHERTT
jgi:hypothetical protein